MLKNLGLSLAALLLLYAVLEGSFLYGLPRVLPAGALVYVEEGLQPLLQSSKRGVVPEHYIALLGDSYAQGMGDWATEAMAQPQARYHTAHLLQDTLQRDVITFGSAGAGSVRALVTEPISQLAYSNRYTLHAVADPDLVLVYFYEGNDLYDNAQYFQYSFPPLFPLSQQFDGNTYQRYLQQFALERDATYRKAQRHDWQRYLPFAAFVRTVYRTLRHVPPPPDPDVDTSLDPPWLFGASAYKEPGQTNRALVDGKLLLLPDKIQGPALGMSDEQTRQAWFAFEQALQFSRAHFARSRFVLVYIPSVLSVYNIQSEQVSVQAYAGRNVPCTWQAAQQSAQAMRAQFNTLAAQQQLPVIDATDALRSAAQVQPLHGPKDWNHLNRRGYEVLAETIIQQGNNQKLF